VTPNHGVCDIITGAFISCYNPMYSSSGLTGVPLCDIDRCALFGGKVIGSPASDCDCGNYTHKDKGCYPTCAWYNGAECGPGSGIETNECRYTSNGGDTIRYANCLCGNGFIEVASPVVNNTMNPPIGTKPVYCEKFCKHGEVDSLWTVSNPTPCVCDGTGFVTFDTQEGMDDYRCGVPKCKGGAPYNATTDTCLCPSPVNMTADCRVLPIVSAGGPPTTSSSDNSWALDSTNAIIALSVASAALVGAVVYLGWKLVSAPTVGFQQIV